jgi:Na+/proline symporter
MRSIDKSAFSLTVGLRAAAFVIAPLIVGFAIKQPDLLLASLGANVLTNTERVLPTIPSRILLVACFTEAASFGLGTLVATTSHLLSPILLGIAIFAALITWASTKWAAVGTFTAIIFAIGVGLPGYSIQSAGLRTLFSLIGMLWALLGIEIQRFAPSHRIQQLSKSESAASEQQQQQQQPPTPRLAALRSALMVGIASALGYTIGLVLGLPRGPSRRVRAIRTVIHDIVVFRIIVFSLIVFTVSFQRIAQHIYTAYAFVALPSGVFAKGSFYFLTYAVIAFGVALVTTPRLLALSKEKGYITASDFIKDRFGSTTLAILIAITGIVSLLPYIALQIVGMQSVLIVMLSGTTNSQ